MACAGPANRHSQGAGSRTALQTVAVQSPLSRQTCSRPASFAGNAACLTLVLFVAHSQLVASLRSAHFAADLSSGSARIGGRSYGSKGFVDAMAETPNSTFLRATPVEAVAHHRG